MADIKYLKGKIYSIRSKLTDKYYIGSTCSSLNKRFGEHNSGFTNYKVGKTYLTSFIIFAYSDAYIELIEDFPCGSRKELERREGELILHHKDKVVNKQVAGGKTIPSSLERPKREILTDEERKNKKTEQRRQYRMNNQDKIREYRNTVNYCECGYRYTNHHKKEHMMGELHQTYLASISVNKS